MAATKLRQSSVPVFLWASGLPLSRRLNARGKSEVLWVRTALAANSVVRSERREGGFRARATPTSRCNRHCAGVRRIGPFGTTRYPHLRRQCASSAQRHRKSCAALTGAMSGANALTLPTFGVSTSLHCKDYSTKSCSIRSRQSSATHNASSDANAGIARDYAHHRIRSPMEHELLRRREAKTGIFPARRRRPSTSKPSLSAGGRPAQKKPACAGFFVS
jgi:hypothetical protein